MYTKKEIQKFFKLFSGNTGGIDNWFGQSTNEKVFERLSYIDKEPLTKVQLNQLLVLSHEADCSDDFFQYYWLDVPKHPYNVEKLKDYDEEWGKKKKIVSLKHLRWGLTRIYLDALLFFGNIQSGYRFFRKKNYKQIEDFFNSHMIDTNSIIERGDSLPLKKIKKDDRYLISEMACKSYDTSTKTVSDLKRILIEAWKDHKARGGGRVKIRDLLDGTYATKKYEEIQQQLLFSADEILDEDVTSDKDIEEKYTAIAKAFIRARKAALLNTKYYLSMVNELDVYVATSMRTREDFRKMANTCEKIFSHPKLEKYKLRYFDPTLSAAEGHEDKGLIECLMVKSAKVLIYSAGKKESYGKDAEAAMALSLGKPVIFYCDKVQKKKFYRDVHPLSRLINFETGVAVGAMVTDNLDYVSELLFRIFENKMEYDLEQEKPGYYRVKERLTQSVVRIQTNDELLRETFWNYYHNNND